MATDPWTSPAPLVSAESATGVFMSRVYRWMAAGLGVTGLVAMALASSPELMQTIFGNRILFFGVIIAQFAMVIAFSAVAQRASFGTTAAMFLGYCALMGVTMASIFVVYTGDSIASTFFVTGGTFLATSAYGALTKRNLDSWGQFLIMGLFGVIIAGVVNLFLRSDAMGFILSCASVVIFTGLTAWDTQKLRALAQAGDDRLALRGALMLYLDFINLFLALLRLFGRRK